jgi:hypothetical protein
MADSNSPQTLLTEMEVSKQLRVSLAALRKWRVLNRGPQYLKIGPLVRYRQSDLDDWLASLPVRGATPGSTAMVRASAVNGMCAARTEEDEGGLPFVLGRGRA